MNRMPWFAVRPALERGESGCLSFLAEATRELLRKIIWPHSQEGRLTRPLAWFCAQLKVDPSEFARAIDELKRNGCIDVTGDEGATTVDLSDFFAPCVEDREAARKALDRHTKSDKSGQLGQKPITERYGTGSKKSGFDRPYGNGVSERELPSRRIP